MTRRLELLEAAIEVIRREGPTASMDEIAAQAGITKPIVYRYFGDRAGLYQAVAERYCADLTSRFQSVVGSSDIDARVIKLIDAYLAFVQDDPQVHQFLLHPQHATRPVVTFGYHVGEVIAGLIRERLEIAGREVAPAEPWGHAVAGMLQGASTWWLVHPEVPRATVVERLRALLWDGLERLTE
jgi:AcrR family transcriptional regulator